MNNEAKIVTSGNLRQLQLDVGTEIEGSDRSWVLMTATLRAAVEIEEKIANATDDEIAMWKKEYESMDSEENVSEDQTSGLVDAKGEILK